MANSSNLIVTQAAVMPSSLTTINVGGAKTSTPLVPTVGGLFPQVDANAAGGGSYTQYLKIFYYNSHGADSVFTAKISLPGCLDALPADSQITFQSDSALDNDKKVRLVYLDTDSVPLVEEVNLNGLTLVSNVDVAEILERVSVRLQSDGSYAALAGNLTIRSTSGPTVIGIIPAGKFSATREVSLGLENSLNGSQTIANPTTAPSSVSFFQPRTAAAALSVIGGTLASTAGQGVWLRQVIREQIAGDSRTQTLFGLYASAS